MRTIPTFPVRISLLVLAGFLLMPVVVPSTALALDVTLMWGSNHESDLAGYRVFLRQENSVFDYRYPEWEGATTQCTIQDLDKNSQYYFVVRAFDTAGNESADSNEIGLPVMLLTPLKGAEADGPPTFEWTPGSCDLYLFCSLFWYPEVGYKAACFWMKDTSLEVPESWWDKIGTGHACYWDVHGFNLTTGHYESPDYKEFIKTN